MNNSQTFSFDALSDTGSSVEIKEGQNKLTIIDAKELLASTGTTMIQFTYSINDSDVKLNYDNCPMLNSEGKKIPFGEHKLKNIMIATATTPKSFTLKTLCAMLRGKSFLANIAKDDKGYWRLQDPNSIISVDYAQNTVFEAEKITPRPTPQETSNFQSVIGEEEIELDINPNTVSSKKW